MQVPFSSIPGFWCSWYEPRLLRHMSQFYGGGGGGLQKKLKTVDDQGAGMEEVPRPTSLGPFASPSQRARRGILMPRGKNFRETLFAAQFKSKGPKGGRRKGGRGRKLSHFSFCCAFCCCVVYSPCFPVWGEEKVMTIYDTGLLAAGPLCGLLKLPRNYPHHGGNFERGKNVLYCGGEAIWEAF